MNDYVGKICPYCRTTIKKDDDIVICSICEMPHHKDCWIENQGCTTFGCLGTINAPNNTANSVTSTGISNEQQLTGNVFCTNCGSPNSSVAKFCIQCGAAIIHTPVTPQYAPQTQQSYYQQQSYNAGYAYPQNNTAYGYQPNYNAGYGYAQNNAGYGYPQNNTGYAYPQNNTAYGYHPNYNAGYAYPQNNTVYATTVPQTAQQPSPQYSQAEIDSVDIDIIETEEKESI